MGDIKLVLFDMDGTLIKDRGIFVIAEKKGFLDELIRLIKYDGIDFYERSMNISTSTGVKCVAHNRDTISYNYSVADVLFIGEDYPKTPHHKRMLKEFKKAKGKDSVIVLPRTKGISTTEIKERMKKC